ncbi:G6pd5p [Glugoides intestinalis]
MTMNKIIVFGASGDLAKRKIMPALSRICGKETKVYGYARSALSKSYAQEVRKFYDYKSEFPEQLIYIQGEYNDLTPLKGIIDSKTIIYFSLPPHVYVTVLQQLSSLDFDFGIVGIEKPFGESFESFKQLAQFKSDKIVFIDHYLLKPMMVAMDEIKKNIPEFFNLLNNQNIEKVECLFAESIFAEGRSYFEKNGIIKDVMQNHLIEMLVSVICESPSHEDNEERLKMIREITISDDKAIYGQYSSYKSDAGNQTETETFAAFICNNNKEKWKGVPFLMAAGKGLNKKDSSIRLTVKADSVTEFINFISKKKLLNCKNVNSITIVFNIAPENKIYMLMSEDTQIGHQKKYKTVVYASREVEEIVEAKFGSRKDYDALFSSMLKGEYYPSVSFEEAEELWRMFSGILDARKELIYYEPGSTVQKDAFELLLNKKQ